MKIALIRVELRLLEPGGVSAPEHASEDMDLPLATDGEGNPWYPPTSVAGSLRRLLGADEAERLLGTEDGDDPRPSAMRVLATQVRLPEGQKPGQRVRNAMDRERGAPRPTALFRSQALPAGSTIEVRLRWDPSDDDDPAHVKTALWAWSPVLGRGGNVGQGRCGVTRLGIRTWDLGTSADLLDWLSLDGPALFDKVVLEKRTSHEPARLLLDEAWYIADALHIGAADADSDPHEGPQVARVLREAGQFVVPGSTWKGIVRARCEYVLRSVGIRACLVGTCGKCPTCLLFGWAPAQRTGSEPSELGAKGSLRFLTCVIEPDPRHKLDRPEPVERQHVALDRVTGGAHDRLLYTEEVIVSGVVRLRVEQDLTRPQYPWARGLLLGAVGDLADGLVGLGRGTTRGQGTLHRMSAPRLTAEELAEFRAALRMLRSPREKQSA